MPNDSGEWVESQWILCTRGRFGDLVAVANAERGKIKFYPTKKRALDDRGHKDEFPHRVKMTITDYATR